MASPPLRTRRVAVGQLTGLRLTTGRRASQARRGIFCMENREWSVRGEAASERSGGRPRLRRRASMAYSAEWAWDQVEQRTPGSAGVCTSRQG
jgi:hypothetical protein